MSSSRLPETSSESVSVVEVLRRRQRRGTHVMSIQSAQLPISSDPDGLRLVEADAAALGSLLCDDYTSAEPYPHIVIDDFLPPQLSQTLLANFPAEPLETDRVFDMNYAGHFKRQVAPESCNGFVREFFHFFNSRPVLAFLEKLTGIDGLLPDPYYEGGGFHEISSGGKLGVHADFRVHDKLHVQRRINLLIYLNPVWDESWNGRLELWDRGMKSCRTAILPLMNRCVVFNTDETSFHGHPDPLGCPPDVKRRSVALYYYTASKGVYADVPSLSTVYHARPDDSREIKREAARYRNHERLRDLLPPFLFRTIEKVRWRLRQQNRSR